jgi:hypothetical protein
MAGVALNAPAAPRKRKDRKDVFFVALMIRSLIVKPEDVGKRGASQSSVGRNDRRSLNGLQRAGKCLRESPGRRPGIADRAEVGPGRDVREGRRTTASGRSLWAKETFAMRQAAIPASIALTTSAAA